VAKALSATERLKVPGCPGGPCGPGGVAKALSATERLKAEMFVMKLDPVGEWQRH